MPTASLALLGAGAGGLRAGVKAESPCRVGQREVLHGLPKGALLLFFSPPPTPRMNLRPFSSPPWNSPCF